MNKRLIVFCAFPGTFYSAWTYIPIGAEPNGAVDYEGAAILPWKVLGFNQQTGVLEYAS
jgi:hypothetical protein